MLSIENTYSLEDLRKFGDRTQKLLPREQIEWVVELKVDGLAVSLIYENGVLVCGVTRGNGYVGDDVTHNIRTVRGVPLRLAGRDPPPVLEVRGEVYMTNSDLVRPERSAEERTRLPLPTRGTWLRGASACWTRGSPPSGGCGSSAIASAESRASSRTITWRSSARWRATAFRPLRWSNDSGPSRRPPSTARS